MRAQPEPGQGRLANSRELLGRFAQRLLAQRPASVLDVGCGAGHLLQTCAAAGVRAVGLEVAPASLAELAAAGLTAVRGVAQALPFADAAFAWVVLRHVAHHLADVPGAVAEAVRVSACGVMIAEPWYDCRLPSQARAQRADSWAKAQERRRGDHHHENLEPVDLLAWLPAGWQIEIERYVRLQAQTWEEFWAENGCLAQDLAADDPGLQELRAIEAECRRGMTWNGTMILMARRPPA